MSVRAKVCLRHFFKDHRQEAFVSVDPNFIHVVNLEKHIRKLFNIKSSIYLTIGGILIPSKESVQVIHSGDIIKVNQVNDDIINSTETPSTEVDLEFSRHATDNQLNDETNSPKRSKRIRKRKRKRLTEGEVEVQADKLNETNSTRQSEKLLKESKKLLSGLSLTNNVDSSQTKANSHIRFAKNDTLIDVTTSSKSAPSEPADVFQPSARVVRPLFVSDVGSTFSPDNGSVQMESPSIHECKQRLVTLKDLANDTSFANVSASIDFKEIIRNIDNTKFFTVLEQELKTYDIVGFKMLKIGKNYEPQLSEWIIAMIKDVEEVDITVHILAGKDETACPNGKLSMEICEEETDSSDLLVLKRSEMLNVKLFLNE